MTGKFLKIFFFITILMLSYQNCGDTGGTSVFDRTSTDVGDNSDLDLMNALTILPPFVGSAKIESNSLMVSGQCNVFEPYTGNRHRVRWDLFRSGSKIQTGITACNFGSYSINNTLNQSYQVGHSYWLNLYLDIDDKPLVQVLNNIITGPDETKPETIEQLSYMNLLGNNNWLSSGNPKSMRLSGSVSNNSLPYVGFTLKAQFKVIDWLPKDKATSIAEFELQNNILLRIYAKRLPNHAAATDTDPTDDLYEVYSKVFGVPGAVGITSQRRSDILVRNQIYTLDVSVVTSANQQITYNYRLLHNDDVKIVNGQSAIPVSNFGYRYIDFITGKKDADTQYVTQNFTNARYKFKVCGYQTNGQPDYSCSLVLP